MCQIYCFYWVHLNNYTNGENKCFHRWKHHTAKIALRTSRQAGRGESVIVERVIHI